MKKITKKAFTETMTQNEIIFGGVTGGGIYEQDYLENYMENMKKSLENTFYDTRTYKARSKDLIANNGSVLDYSQKGKHTFYKLENSNGKLLIWNYESDSETYGKSQKAMYYYIAA